MPLLFHFLKLTCHHGQPYHSVDLRIKTLVQHDFDTLHENETYVEPEDILNNDEMWRTSDDDELPTSDDEVLPPHFHSLLLGCVLHLTSLACFSAAVKHKSMTCGCGAVQVTAKNMKCSQMAIEPEQGEPGTATPTPVPSSQDFDTEQIMSFITQLSNYENGNSLAFEKVKVCLLPLSFAASADSPVSTVLF